MSYKVDNSYDMTYFPWKTDQSYRARQLSIVTPDTIQSLFLYDINKKIEVELRLIPNSLSEQYAARILKESGIYGRLRPINFYTGGGPKSLSFSFELHEDLNAIDGSLYNLLNRIKDMSKPSYNNARGVIDEPVIYFQLGDQFAGMGHIDSEYTLNKPFRLNESSDNLGRYAMASVSITFTYHEEFESVQKSISDTGTVYSSSVAVDLDAAYRNYLNIQAQDPRYGRVPDLTSVISIDDFIERVTGSQYYITQSFVDEKMLGGYLNAIGKAPSYSTQVTTSQGLRMTLDEALESGQRIQYSYGDGTNPYAIQVFNYYIDLSNILSTDLIVVDKMSAMDNFYRLVEQSYKDMNYLVAISKTGLTQIEDFSIIQVKIAVGSNLTIDMSVKEADRTLTEFRNLLRIISDQRAVYSALKGAGD